MSNNKVIGSRGRMVPLLWGMFVALILSAVSPLAQTAGSSAGSRIPPKLLVYPQMILHNGKILTVDESFGIVQAVAIRDERFLEVGTNQEVLCLGSKSIRHAARSSWLSRAADAVAGPGSPIRPSSVSGASMTAGTFRPAGCLETSLAGSGRGVP